VHKNAHGRPLRNSHRERCRPASAGQWRYSDGPIRPDKDDGFGKRHRSVRILAAGHAFVHNLRRGHYDIATESSGPHRLCIAFDKFCTGYLKAAAITIVVPPDTVRRLQRGHKGAVPDAAVPSAG
jgi:hypothetical protein